MSGAQQSASDWLAQHEQWRTMAQSWERWDVLFVQAGQAASQAEKLTRALARVQHNADRHHADAADANAKLTASASALQTLEAQRQAVIQAWSAFSPDALRSRRGELELRRDLLAGAEKIWIELNGRQRRSRELDAQTAQLHHAKQHAETLLAQAQHDNIAIMATFAQAERSLKIAEAACAENVEHLRATLEDDTPCPVCGAHEHPYRHDDGVLQAMLGGLQADLAQRRQQVHDNVVEQAAQRSALQASIAQLTAIAAETRTQHEVLERVTLAWRGHALLKADADVPADEALRAGWFDAQLAAAQAGLQDVERQERAMHNAATAKDQAQSACDRTAADHARLQEVASGAQTALAQVGAEHKALDEQRIEVALQMSALLDDLDAAFSGGDIPTEDWKDDWKTGPARFHEARLAESRQWLAQRAAYDERAAAIAAVDIEGHALAEAQSKAAQDAIAARSTFRAADDALTATQSERLALWDGREVRDVEAELLAAIDSARARLQTQQVAAEQAAQTRTRLDEALAQAGLRLSALELAAVAAARALSDWLADFQQSQSAETPFDMEQLRALLALSLDAIAAERRALQAIDHAAGGALAVWKERQSQREQHQHSAPQDSAHTADTLNTALQALAVDRKDAHDVATAHRLGIAQDDARRRAAQSMLAEIEQQEDVERRWARMSDLIGSADGKKFRNYAQQFTLDVLLGYANAHLNHLARRYQLERINNPANPSLGLLVRDQDMGGEMRSVHSLSGGESFLVSLALALGLASLSSNRVKVESLFIDEGFGSLDAETLRVAMDALDGLQAMGRKVGVISHVQEMTERIATKILVQPSAGGKSVVMVQ